MPISQERMLRVLSAGRDYQGALRRALAMVQSSARQVESGLPAEGVVKNLGLSLKEQFLLQKPLESPGNLDREEDHFKRVGKKNDKRRAKLREASQEHMPGEIRPVDVMGGE